MKVAEKRRKKSERIGSPKILSLSKTEFRNYYAIEKKQEFFSLFRAFLVDIGFEKGRVSHFGRPDGKDHLPDESREEDIRKHVDDHDSFYNDERSVEVVFGKKKVFIMIFVRKGRLKDIHEKLGKFFQPAEK